MPRDKFYVGQRVLWKCPTGDDYTATVISQRARRKQRYTGKWALVYRLDVDGFGTGVAGGYIFGAQEPELRPLYDGDQPSTWDAVERICGWNPDRAEVSAAGRCTG